METKILLCCLNPTVDPQAVDELTIYDIFKKYGTVKNVKIFSRDVLIKAFIEISDDSVENCIENTHLQIFQIGKLKVYVSHKNNVTFDRDLKTIISESAHLKTSTSQLNSYFMQNSEARSQSYKMAMKSGKNNTIKKTTFKLSNISQSEEDLDQIFDDGMFIDYKNIKSVTEINSKIPDLVRYYPVSLEAIQHAKSSHLAQNNSSKVLVVNRVNTIDVNCLMLMNLFGCFGNIKKILLNLKSAFALVEMETDEQGRMAIKHLNNVIFFGSNLKVKTSKYNTVSSKSLEKEKNPDVQFLRGHYKYFRYKEDLQIKVNKPSNIVHVTFLSGNFTSYLLYKLVSQINEPAKIVKMNKNSIVSEMYLVEFETVNQAIEVLSVLHNKKIDGKLLKISFSHTDISEFN